MKEVRSKIRPNIAKNKIKRIKKALLTAKGKAVELLQERLQYYENQLK